MPRFFQLTWALLLILIGFTTAVTFIGDDPVVELSLGRIQGDTMQSFRNKTIYAFRGIRYAQSPVGQLRFANPVPETSWGDEVFKATSDSLVCPQPGVVSLMSEDCLKINVFTKSFADKFPVMVYIHGGANVLGSGHSSYEAGPQYLLDQDVVFVAFNYRLGALGFLSTNSSETKGNFGFLDQVMALEWVRDHISHFGGDPELVTIIGISAGSMAVSLHLASPLSAGLFHRAILMSGSATNHFDIDNLFWTRKLARELGCPMYDPTDVVECLRNETWTRIVEVCKAWETYQLVNMKWNYEIDGHFLHNHPTELIKEGNFNKVPLLISFTANEFDYNANGVVRLLLVKYLVYLLTFFIRSALGKPASITRFCLKLCGLCPRVVSLSPRWTNWRETEGFLSGWQYYRNQFEKHRELWTDLLWCLYWAWCPSSCPTSQSLYPSLFYANGLRGWSKSLSSFEWRKQARGSGSRGWSALCDAGLLVWSLNGGKWFGCFYDGTFNQLVYPLCQNRVSILKNKKLKMKLL